MRRATWMMGLLLALSGNAWGAVIGIELTATITEIEDWNGLLGDSIHLGDTITVKYVYDSEAVDTGSGYYGRYMFTSAPYGIVVRAGDLVFQTDPDNVEFKIGVGNDDPQGGDSYSVYSYNNICASGGLWINELSIQLNDFSGTAIDTTALPLLAPDLEDWPDTWSHLLVGYFLSATTPEDEDQCYYFRATITSATLAADPYDPLLPEPGTMMVVGLGLAALAWRRRA